jgi:hypothetical protein
MTLEITPSAKTSACSVSVIFVGHLVCSVCDLLYVYLSKIQVSKTFKLYCDVRLQYLCYFCISFQEVGYFLLARSPLLMLILISSHVELNMQNLHLKEYCVSRSDVILLPLETIQHIIFLLPP